MSHQDEPEHTRVEMTQITHEIHAIEPIDVHTAIAVIVEHYGGTEKQMYLTINGFYQADAYRATTDMIDHLMESYRYVMNYRGMLINRVALTIIHNDHADPHEEPQAPLD